MKIILRQAALTFGFVGALYAVVLGVTFIVEPTPPAGDTLDVWAAGDTLFVTSAKYAFLGRDMLATPQRKIILVGASNTGLGFRPSTLQPLVRCAQVDNLAIGGANISETRQMIDLIRDVQDPASRQANVFVIGVWFGMFIDTDQMWPGADRHHGDTDLDIERYRYDFYRRTSEGPVAVLPPSWLRFGVIAIRPYLLVERLARSATAKLRDKLFVRPPELTDADREARVLSPEERAQALQYWRNAVGRTGEISGQQMTLLHDTIEDLLRSGGKVVLVDLPIPAWHRDASPFQPGYARALQDQVLARFAGWPGFAALTMPDLGADTDFSDEVHAKPHVTKIWERRLAGVLNPLVCPANTAAATTPGLPPSRN